MKKSLLGGWHSISHCPTNWWTFLLSFSLFGFEINWMVPAATFFVSSIVIITKSDVLQNYLQMPDEINEIRNEFAHAFLLLQTGWWPEWDGHLEQLHKYQLWTKAFLTNSNAFSFISLFCWHIQMLWWSTASGVITLYPEQLSLVILECFCEVLISFAMIVCSQCHAIDGLMLSWWLFAVGSVLLRDEASAAENSQVVINMDGAERYTKQMQLIDQQARILTLLNDHHTRATQPLPTPTRPRSKLTWIRPRTRSPPSGGTRRNAHRLIRKLSAFRGRAV